MRHNEFVVILVLRVDLGLNLLHHTGLLRFLLENVEGLSVFSDASDERVHEGLWGLILLLEVLVNSYFREWLVHTLIKD